MTYDDGRLYKGKWRQGVQDGIGIFVDKRGIERKGLWKTGKKIKWI